MSKFMEDMPDPFQNQAEVTINAKRLNDMLGADAAEIGYDIARCAHEGSSVIKVYIDRDDPKCPDPSDDIYENNGIKFSRYLEYMNSKRIAPSYFPLNDIEEVNKCDPVSIANEHRGFAAPLDENWNMHYDEKANEVHIPVESTFIMDERDCASMAMGILDSAINKGNGRTEVVFDGYDKETYHHKADKAVMRYNESAREILKDQKLAPSYRGNLINFNTPIEW